jgi:hypothetical protein
VAPALESSCHKRARKEEVGGDSGRVEDDRCSPRLEPVAGETRTEDLAHPEVSANIVPHPAAAPENDSAPAAETTPVGVDTPPPPAAEGATAGDDGRGFGTREVSGASDASCPSSFQPWARIDRARCGANSRDED